VGMQRYSRLHCCGCPIKANHAFPNVQGMVWERATNPESRRASGPA
jgi:hypothetical protein